MTSLSCDKIYWFEKNLGNVWLGPSERELCVRHTCQGLLEPFIPKGSACCYVDTVWKIEKLKPSVCTVKENELLRL